jgi:hypothetical protein
MIHQGRKISALASTIHHLEERGHGVEMAATYFLSSRHRGHDFEVVSPIRLLFGGICLGTSTEVLPVPGSQCEKKREPNNFLKKQFADTVDIPVIIGARASLG